MTTYQMTLNEQTLQRLFTSDRQLAQLLESILELGARSPGRRAGAGAAL